MLALHVLCAVAAPMNRIPSIASRLSFGLTHGCRSKAYGTTLIGRREMLHIATATASLYCAPPVFAQDPALNLPQYDVSGRLIVSNGYSEETQFKILDGGSGASVRVLGAWTRKPDGSWADPVLGSTASSVEMRSTPISLGRTSELGRPEKIELVSTLNLDEDLKRADLVAAAVRKDDNTGAQDLCLCSLHPLSTCIFICAEYYDFDLALPAKSCVPELATACLPVKVVLISLAISAGKLHVLQVAASADEWRRAGVALRNLRSSFSVQASK